MPKEQIEKLTSKELGSAAKVLADLSALLTQAKHDVDEAHIDELWCFRVDSLRRALDRASAFHPELYKSLTELNAGRPYDSSTVKNPKRRKED